MLHYIMSTAISIHYMAQLGGKAHRVPGSQQGVEEISTNRAKNTEHAAHTDDQQARVELSSIVHTSAACLQLSASLPSTKWPPPHCGKYEWKCSPPKLVLMELLIADQCHQHFNEESTAGNAWHMLAYPTPS